MLKNLGMVNLLVLWRWWRFFSFWRGGGFLFIGRGGGRFLLYGCFSFFKKMIIFVDGCAGCCHFFAESILIEMKMIIKQAFLRF